MSYPNEGPPFSEELGSLEGQRGPEIKDKLGDPFKMMLVNHIQRCLIAKSNGDEIAYLAATKGFLNALPTHKRMEINNNRDQWTIEVTEPKFLYNVGQKVGSLEQPKMRKIPGTYNTRYPIPYITDEDGKQVVDWDDPHILSPRMQSSEVENPDALFTMCLDAVEEAGMTYTKAPGLKDAGPLPDAVPRHLLVPVVDLIKELVKTGRKKGLDIGYNDFIEALAQETPETPVKATYNDE
jgi:hypothetical protein